MKKIALLSALMFAASSMFAQAANPTKTSKTVSNHPEAPKPKNNADVKAAGGYNPVGKNGVNTSKAATAIERTMPAKVNTKKASSTNTTNKN